MQTASCTYCGLQDYSVLQLTLIVHDYDGTSTQMECSDVISKIGQEESDVYFWQLWRSEDIVNITFQTLCICLFERIVKNGAGNGCGTRPISKKCQHS